MDRDEKVRFVARLRRAFWDKAEQTACRIFHLLLRAKSNDRTSAMVSRPALILAPHADDETLGCGGTIALKRQSGTRVFVAIATDGAASHRTETWTNTTLEELVALRKTETFRACQILGVEDENVKFMGLPDSKLSEKSAELVESIQNLIRQSKPEEVYVCARRDGHPDHVALSEAARQALQDRADVDLFEYPVWSFDFRSWRHFDKTNTHGFISGVKDMRQTLLKWKMASVAITSQLQTKASALDAHQSQLGKYAPEPLWSGLPATFLKHFFVKSEVFRLIEKEQVQSE